MAMPENPRITEPSGPPRTRTLFSGDFLKKLDLLDILTRKIRRGTRRGERPSTGKGQGLEFSDHRPYAAGDDLRYIDWNAYSRLNELHLKQFEAEENMNLAVFVDCSASMDFGAFNKLDAALRTAAALGYVGLSRYDSVSFYASGAGDGRVMRVFSGKTSRPALIEHAAAVRASADGGGLDGFAAGIAARSRGPSAAVVLSDFYEADAMAWCMGILAGRRFDVGAVHFIDPSETAPPHSGRMLFTDAETGGRSMLDVTGGVAEAYRKRFAVHLNRVERMISSKGMQYTRFETSPDSESRVIEILRSGILLGKRARPG